MSALCLNNVAHRRASAPLNQAVRHLIRNLLERPKPIEQAPHGGFPQACFIKNTVGCSAIYYQSKHRVREHILRLLFFRCVDGIFLILRLLQ